MTFSRQQIADVCRMHALDVNPALIRNYDPAQLLWAFCGNESSFGANCTPRKEPAYDFGGAYSANPQQAALLHTFGSAAACSYGPMQVMLVNAPVGVTPDDFSGRDALNVGMRAGVFALNTLFARNRPGGLAEMGACYNAGHIPKGTWPDGVRRYANDLIVHYAEPMPEEILKG